MTVVYVGTQGVVTDAGSSLVCRSDDGGPDILLGRYGVWKPRASLKSEVVLVTDSLEEAVLEAEREGGK